MVINQYIRRVPVVALNYGQHARPIAVVDERGLRVTQVESFSRPHG